MRKKIIFGIVQEMQIWNISRVTYTVTLDGFIISDNIECVKYDNINTGYTYSDHDPVYVKFKLK